MLALAVVGGGWWLYRHFTYEWVPTWVALAFQSHNWASGLLSGRFQYGDLSEDQANRMFEQAFAHDAKLALKSPYPARVEMPADLRCSLALGGPKVWSWILEVESTAVRVDGVVVSESAQHWLAGYAPFMETVSVSIPGQAPGRHAIEVTLLIAVRGPAFNGDAPGEPWHRWTVTATGDVVTQDRPPSDFVRVRYSRELAAGVERGLELPTTRRNRPTGPAEIPYSFEELPIDVVGEVWARPSGDGDYLRVIEFFAFARRPGIMGERREGSGVIRLDKLPGIEHVSSVDICIFTDTQEVAGLALQLGVTEYFGGCIERLNIPVTTAVTLGEHPEH